MIRERIDEMLSVYRETKARCAHIEAEIRELTMLIESMKRTIVDDEVSTTSVISDMPRGGKTSDPTANVAIMLADGNTPERIKEVEQELEGKKTELQSKMTVVIFVEAWLIGLNQREKYLVESKVIDGNYWRTVIQGYSDVFGEVYSKQGLKNLLSSAMEKIYRIAE